MQHLAPLLFAASVLFAADDKTNQLPPPASDKPADSQKSTYSAYVGTHIALQLLKNDIVLEDIDIEHFLRALEDGMTGKTDLRKQLARQDIPTHLQQQSETRRKKLAEKTKKEGETFLAENSKKPDITTTASGLQYRIDRQGTGTAYNKKEHGTNPTYTVKYTVRTLEGTLVSDFTDETVEATDHSRLEGFDEGLSLMPVGSQWTFFLPSHLAFGDEHIVTRSSILPANSVLIIQVEMFGIKKGDETQTISIGGTPFEFIPIDDNESSGEDAE